MRSEEWIDKRIEEKREEKEKLKKEYGNHPNFEVAMILGYLSALYDVLDVDLDEEEEI